MERTELDSQKVPKSTLPPSKNCMESYSKKSQNNASPQDNGQDTSLRTTYGTWREIIDGVHTSHVLLIKLFP